MENQSCEIIRAEIFLFVLKFRLSFISKEHNFKIIRIKMPFIQLTKYQML